MQASDLTHTRKEAGAGVTLVATEGRPGSPGSLFLSRTHLDGQPLSLEPLCLVYQAAHNCALFGPHDMRYGGRHFSDVTVGSVNGGPVQGHAVVCGGPWLPS